MPIASLAVPGVIAAVALTAAILTPVVGALGLADGFTWGHGLIFGALIAATDPIAVVALFKSTGAPRDLGVMVEGESLLNDGTAIVFFSLILAIVAGEAMTASDVIVDFAVTVGGGVCLGVVIGMAVSEVMKRIDDPMIEITLTTIAAYGSFVGAEHFHLSGVIATVSAGMLCGNYTAREGMGPSTRMAVESFWEYLAFALNSIVFLLIGFEVEIASLLQAWRPIVSAYLAVLAARVLVVAVVSGGMHAARRPIPWSWTTVLAWGGLRGGISMVLALSLTAAAVGGVENRNLLVTMTMGVVTLVILVHGLTMPALLRGLGLTRARREREEFELTRGRLHVANRALAAIQRMVDERFTDRHLLQDLEREYQRRIEAEQRRLERLHLEHADLRNEELVRARRRLLFIERRQAYDAYRGGLMSEEILHRILADIDARLMRVEKCPRQRRRRRKGERAGRKTWAGEGPMSEVSDESGEDLETLQTLMAELEEADALGPAEPDELGFGA